MHLVLPPHPTLLDLEKLGANMNQHNSVTFTKKSQMDLIIILPSPEPHRWLS